MAETRPHHFKLAEVEVEVAVVVMGADLDVPLSYPGQNLLFILDAALILLTDFLTP